MPQLESDPDLGSSLPLQPAQPTNLHHLSFSVSPQGLASFLPSASPAVPVDAGALLGAEAGTQQQALEHAYSQHQAFLESYSQHPVVLEAYRQQQALIATFGQHRDIAAIEREHQALLDAYSQHPALLDIFRQHQALVHVPQQHQPEQVNLSNAVLAVEQAELRVSNTGSKNRGRAAGTRTHNKQPNSARQGKAISMEGKEERQETGSSSRAETEKVGEVKGADSDSEKRRQKKDSLDLLNPTSVREAPTRCSGLMAWSRAQAAFVSLPLPSHGAASSSSSSSASSASTARTSGRKFSRRRRLTAPKKSRKARASDKHKQEAAASILDDAPADRYAGRGFIVHRDIMEMYSCCSTVTVYAMLCFGLV